MTTTLNYLFLNDEGEPLNFFVGACTKVNKLSEVITDHGGSTARLLDDDPKLIPLFEDTGLDKIRMPARACYRVKYIEDCIKAGKRLPLADYEISASSSSSSSSSTTTAPTSSAKQTRSRSKQTAKTTTQNIQKNNDTSSSITTTPITPSKVQTQTPKGKQTTSKPKTPSTSNSNSTTSNHQNNPKPTPSKGPATNSHNTATTTDSPRKKTTAIRTALKSPSLSKKLKEGYQEPPPKPKSKPKQTKKPSTPSKKQPPAITLTQFLSSNQHEEVEEVEEEASSNAIPSTQKHKNTQKNRFYDEDDHQSDDDNAIFNFLSPRYPLSSTSTSKSSSSSPSSSSSSSSASNRKLEQLLEPTTPPREEDDEDAGREKLPPRSVSKRAVLPRRTPGGSEQPASKLQRLGAPDHKTPSHTQKPGGEVFGGEYPLSDAWAVVEELQSKTQLPLPVVFHALIVCSGVPADALAYLEDAGNTPAQHLPFPVWTPEEDRILQSNESNLIDRVLNERGRSSVLSRVDFLEPIKDE